MAKKAPAQAAQPEAAPKLPEVSVSEMGTAVSGDFGIKMAMGTRLRKGELADAAMGAKFSEWAYDKSPGLGEDGQTVSSFTVSDPNAARMGRIKEISVIAFKGSITLADFAQDVSLGGKPRDLYNEFSRKGKQDMEKILIQKAVDDIASGKDVFITGHSLGGYYASEFALALKEAAGSDWDKIKGHVKLVTVDPIGVSPEFLKKAKPADLEQMHVVSEASIAQVARNVNGLMQPEMGRVMKVSYKDADPEGFKLAQTGGMMCLNEKGEEELSRKKSVLGGFKVGQVKNAHSISDMRKSFEALAQDQKALPEGAFSSARNRLDVVMKSEGRLSGFERAALNLPESLGKLERGLVDAARPQKAHALLAGAGEMDRDSLGYKLTHKLETVAAYAKDKLSNERDTVKIYRNGEPVLEVATDSAGGVEYANPHRQKLAEVGKVQKDLMEGPRTKAMMEGMSPQARRELAYETLKQRSRAAGAYSAGDFPQTLELLERKAEQSDRRIAEAKSEGLENIGLLGKRPEAGGPPPDPAQVKQMLESVQKNSLVGQMLDVNVRDKLLANRIKAALGQKDSGLSCEKPSGP